MMAQRLQKVLATAGIASRRGAEDLIRQARVRVNGEIARIGLTVDPDNDRIEVDGRLVTLPTVRHYVAFHKPVGTVTSTRSTHGEKTIFDVLRYPHAVLPVGRLDRDTSGLLLLTDDGDWANLVAHPRFGIEKEYETWVKGDPSSADLDRLRTGVTLPDGTVTAPARVSRIATGTGRTLLSIGVVEGRKRQIRLMAEIVGHPVEELKRVRIGSIELGHLTPGEWRELTPREVADVIRRGH